MKNPYDVTRVEHLGGYRLQVSFADGLVAVIDLTDKLGAEVGPMFEPLRDEQFFAMAKVDEELATVVWPNGADLAPEVMHDEAVGAA